MTANLDVSISPPSFTVGISSVGAASRSWNDVDESIASKFLEISKRFSGKTAVVSLERQWTYSELADNALRISSCIRELTKCPEPILLLLPHRLELTAAIFGTILSGNFYVPLGVQQPLHYLQAVAAESGSRIILAADELLGLAREIAPSLQVIPISAKPEYDQPVTCRAPSAHTYVLFTSGTTGTPKGVLQCDSNVLHHAERYASSIDLQADDAMTLFAAYSFDAAVMDIFATLLSGATLCIWDFQRNGFDGLEAWLRKHKVTIWHSTPSVLRAALPLLEQPLDLKWIVLGGEVATGKDVDLVVRGGGTRCKLINGYGPTECTTAFQYLVDLQQDGRLSRLPIGRPLDGMAAILRTGDEQSLQDGKELILRSKYLALGYWKQPELTASRFTASFQDDDVRAYQTGDFVKWGADGNLEYLGRIDDQIKIRGQKVHLAEVQLAISNHGLVEHAEVIAKPDPDTAETEICAFIVAKPGVSPDAAARSLRETLSENLLPSSIPKRFVFLDQIPLRANGKVDLAALPEYGDLPIPPPGQTKTALEAIVSQIWGEVLRRRCVDVEDNFFEIGGDSLEAARIVARINLSLLTDLKPRDLFESPSVSALCRRLVSGLR